MPRHLVRRRVRLKLQADLADSAAGSCCLPLQPIEEHASQYPTNPHLQSSSVLHSLGAGRSPNDCPSPLLRTPVPLCTTLPPSLLPPISPPATFNSPIQSLEPFRFEICAATTGWHPAGSCLVAAAGPCPCGALLVCRLVRSPCSNSPQCAMLAPFCNTCWGPGCCKPAREDRRGVHC